jgi:NCS1 family nucleobase:cation symporter-1
MTEELKGTVKEGALRPTTPDLRIFRLVSYFLMWWSSLIAVQVFILGQGLLPPIGQLNLFQGLTVVVLSGVIIVVMFALNGQAGLKHGIPFTVQCRSCFGLRGAMIVEFLRIVPAVVWYGVGSWIAALSFDGIVLTLTGFTAPNVTFVYFIIFQIIQSYLAYRGLRTLRWFTVMCSVIIFLVMSWMLVDILNNYGFTINETWKIKGTWGAPFWIGLTACIGAMATMMLNIGDLTRYVEQRQSTNWWGHLIGIIPPWFFMVFLGLVAGAAIGEWNPVAALMKLSPHPALMVVLLIFVLLAQFSTNLILNIMPSSLIFMERFKISWGTGVIVSAVLAVASCPWFILGNMEAYFSFIAYYASFFGPVLGVMLADYWVVQKRKYNLDALYVEGPEGPCWFTGGFNTAGMLSIFIPGVIAMIWFLPASWLVGLPLGFGSYCFLVASWSHPRSQQAIK